MHNENARPLRREDVVEGLPVLLRHGYGYVPGVITTVRRKVREQREDGSRYGAVIATGEEINYSVKADIGWESGSSFQPPWIAAADPAALSVDEDVKHYCLVRQEDGQPYPVLDYIGCVSAGIGNTVFLPGVTDPAEAKSLYLSTVIAAGFEVIAEPNFRPATEQRVVLYHGFGAESGVKAVCYEHETERYRIGGASSTSYIDPRVDVSEALTTV